MENNQSYTIQKWMSEELGLSGNKLLVYALIYDFSQGGETVFYGTAAYVAEWINATRRTVMDTLNDLTKSGYLIKYVVYDKGVRLCGYRINEIKLPVAKE